jgi:hypothetical protein
MFKVKITFLLVKIVRSRYKSHYDIMKKLYMYINEKLKEIWTNFIKLYVQTMKYL